MVELMSREYMAEQRMRAEYGGEAGVAPALYRGPKSSPRNLAGDGRGCGDVGSIPTATIDHRATRAQAVSQTSRDSFERADLDHRVYEVAIEQLCDAHPCAPFTTRELAVLIGTLPSNLTQPVKRLRDRGALVLAGRKKNVSGSFADSWITPRRSRELAQQEDTP